MTVQELCDELTVLSHRGFAQAEVRHISGELVPETCIDDAIDFIDKQLGED